MIKIDVNFTNFCSKLQIYSNPADVKEEMEKGRRVISPVKIDLEFGNMVKVRNIMPLKNRIGSP